MPTIRENLEWIQERIAAAARRAGRDPAEITLVGVTKTHPPDLVLEALAAGLAHVGENRAEELEVKRPAVAALLPAGAAEPTWHMVGHVQSRKAERVAFMADVVHSLDSLKLAQRLARFAAEAGRTLPVLLEVNLSGEENKYGLQASGWESDPAPWVELQQLVEGVTVLPHLRLQGLMTMAPWVPDPDVIRPIFRSARLLRDRLAATFPAGDWRHLSMGMTDDFEIAIEEGATLVRIGRAIFGPRITP